MEFKKLHLKSEKYIRSFSHRDLKPNFISVYIKDHEIIVEELKFYTLKKNFRIFPITPNFHLLCYEGDDHVLIVIKKVAGRPTYITDNGYFSVVEGHHKVCMQYHNFEDCITYTKNFISKKSSFLVNEYTVYKIKRKGRECKISIYYVEEFAIKDFQAKNKTYPKIQEYSFLDYYMSKERKERIEHINNSRKGIIPVNFKDCTKMSSVAELISLQSYFIDDQINLTDAIYLDVEYSNFENKTFEFLAYIKSYLLTLFFEHSLRQFVKRDFFSLCFDIVSCPDFEEALKDFIINF